MRTKMTEPPEMVAIRHESDASDEFTEVTRQSFDDYYSQNGWNIVERDEVLFLEGADSEVLPGLQPEEVEAQQLVDPVPDPDDPTPTQGDDD